MPHLAEIEEIVRREGGYGAALSGAGPTVLSLVSGEKTAQRAKKFEGSIS